MTAIFLVCLARTHNYDNYFEMDSEIMETGGSNGAQRPTQSLLNIPTPSKTPAATTECVTDSFSRMLPGQEQQDKGVYGPQQSTTARPELNAVNRGDEDDEAKQLKMLVQLLYIAQARVQLEVAEIKKAQAVANSAQQLLEEAANHVRTITAELQNSQKEVAAVAIRAQTAQLKLAAHDQLLFAARQDVDALSAQLVGLQAAEGITQTKTTANLADFFEKLKQPLLESEKPFPVPLLIHFSTQPPTLQQNHKLRHRKAPDYQTFYDS